MKQTHLLLAAVRNCPVTQTHPTLDIQYYEGEGRLEIIDASTIQCLVGRVHDRGRWAIIDRSGALAREFYLEDGEE